MKPSTIVLIVVFILVLYYYTAETYDVVKIVGKNVYNLVGNVISDIGEHDQRGVYDRIKDSFSDLYRELVKS